MGALHQMQSIARELEYLGIRSIVPPLDNSAMLDALEDIQAAKREASLRHMGRIAYPDTWAVLVVNVDRYGHHDYIGPNSFAEVAVAVARQKPVYLYQGIPVLYQEELGAWGVQPLFGNLHPLVRQQPLNAPVTQLSLFGLAS
jgi:hypothetical protein